MNLSPNEVLAISAVKDIYASDLSYGLRARLDAMHPRDAEAALRAARTIPQLRAALVITCWIDEVTYVTKLDREYVSRNLRVSAEKCLELLLG